MQRVRESRLLRVCIFAFALMVMTSMLAINTNESYAATKKPVKVSSVKLTKKTTSTLKIKWKKAKYAKKYQVAYKKKGAKKYSYVKTTKTYRTIKKLKAGTVYCIKVRGINGKKYGKWSKIYKWKTKVKTSPSSTVDFTKAKNESKIKVSVTDEQVVISIKSLGLSGKGTLYSTRANAYFTGDDISGLVSKRVSGSKIGTFALNTAKTFKIDRNTASGYDRLYDKYYVVQNGKIIKGPIYATEVASNRDKVEMDVPSKKGLVDELDEDSYICTEDLGSNWTAINIDFTELMLANEKADGTPIDNSRKNVDTIEVNGKTYYVDQSYVSFLDSRLIRYKKMGVNVVGIVVSFVETESSCN